MTAKRPRGRPSSYSQEVADRICEAIMTADGGLEVVCEGSNMPHAATVYRWLNDPEKASFRDNYARAREIQGDYQAGKGLAEALTATDAGLGRLKWDARRWHASKLAPKKYGDKITHAGDEEAPIKVERIVRRIVHADD